MAVFAIPAWAQTPVQVTTVETFTDNVLPGPQPPASVVPYDSPLTAGQMTLQDVLRAHPKKPAAAPLLAPPAINPALTSSATAPHPASQSSANLMLMQGMKSALQQNGVPVSGGYGASTLKAPQMQPPQPPAGTAPIPPAAITAAEAAGAIPVPASALSPSAIAASVTTPSDMRYLPGQEPKDLATGKALGAATAAPTSISVAPPGGSDNAEPMTGASISNAALMSGAPSSGPAQTVIETTSGVPDANGCVPRSTSWVKTCPDAGYPENYLGQIKGETQTVCPGNILKDVWIDNNCSPPDGNSNAPLSAPSASSVSSASGSSQNATSMEISNAMAQQVPNVRGDASCGPSNGLAAAYKPAGDLCASGQATEVSGNGPWRWSCNGAKGGMTVSCAAPLSAAAAQVNNSSNGAATSSALNPDMASTEDGICGGAAAIGSDHAPAANLCAHGSASRVSGSGPWTWACSGLNGGQAAACEAPLRADGVCGAANAAPAGQMPMADLCSEGYASAVTGDGPWNWTCSGLNGGSAATCSAAPMLNAVCGAASLSGHQRTPDSNLCSVGHASMVSGSGPWAWSCDGSNGGASVACTASVSQNGACGNANGGAFTHAPTSELCSHGNASRVTGAGPWSWNCEGNDGGNTESCTALVKDTRYEGVVSTNSSSPSSSSSAADNAPAAAPVAPVTKPAKAVKSAKSVKSSRAPAPVAETAPAAPEEVTPSYVPQPSSPSPSVAAPAPRDRAVGRLCGSAAELMAIEAPDHDLCQNGTAGPISGDGPFNWTCSDDSGSTSKCSTLAPAGSLNDVIPSAPVSSSAVAAAEESAPVVREVTSAPVVESRASCGLSAGRGASQAPADNLCAVGKASAVRGSGPWRWSCAKGKEKVSCEAPMNTEGVCGAINGSVQKFAPVTGLCAGGTPTEVQGNGPWLWSCVGSGGGASVSCSAASQAQTRVDGSCGVAATNASTSTPVSNLCDSGVASNVYGEGPWTWTCSGLNGGVASSCSTQRSVPSAPPPPGPSLNGLCGPANGVAAIVQPMDGLCSTGTTTAVSGNGPWNWNCLGENGGMTVSCTAPLQPPAPITGVCGGANGVSTLTTPRSGLCSAGISSAVSGHGPWTWSCSGTNGGGAVGCVAPLAQSGGTGALPSLVTPSDMGEAPAPQSAPQAPVTPSVKRSAGLVTPRLPSGGPLSPLSNGSMPPQRIPSGNFPTPPQPSTIPSEPMSSDFAAAPGSEPDLPSGTTDLMPPPVRDTIQPAPALRPNAIDAHGTPVAGNHFVLDDDISTLPFQHGSENIGGSETALLDKLANVLRANSGVRVTLTAYADAQGSTPREARRLSLTRALAIRDYLTSKGISSSRVDVRALGANVPSGDGDRVDIKAN